MSPVAKRPGAKQASTANKSAGMKKAASGKQMTGAKRTMAVKRVPTTPAKKSAAVKRASTTKKAPAIKRASNARNVLARRTPRLSPDEVETLFSRLSQLNPKPTTELEYSTPYELLVAVTLSAQATDVGVNKATRKLFKVANTPAAIAALGVEGLKPYIATIGLFNTKAANVVAMAHQLLERHAGEVPRDRDALQALPGVGRKTANVVLNTAFGEPTIAVDTHIFRVANRTGLAPGKDVRAVEDALEKVVPRHYLQDAHHWLILHGRYICMARKPDCPHCPIRDICRYPDKTPGEPTGVDPDA